MASSERYRIAVEAAPCGALLVDETGCIVLVNERLAEMFETTTEALVGSNVDMLVPEDLRDTHADFRKEFANAPVERAMGSGRELWGLTAAGRRIPIEVSLHPAEALTLGMVVDITARKREQERFRVALDAAPNALLMVDSQGTIVLCNRNTEHVFGYTRDELVGRPIEVLIPPEAAARHRHHQTGYMTSPTQRTMGAGRELEALRKDGERFPVEVALQPVDMDDEPHVVASVVDISVRVETQQALDAQHALLEERNRELRALARSTSHSLKGPLTTIAGLAGSILADLEDNTLENIPKIVEWTRTLARETAKSLDRLREVADATEDRHAVSRFNVVECFHDVAVELEPRRAAAEVEIRVQIPDDLELTAERPRVSSILYNLLANAFDYHDPSEPKRWVEVSAARDANVVRLVLRDNGVGIPDEMRGRVFELFERGEFNAPSYGIGLALVRRHVRQLKGSVRLAPHLPTTFIVEIPLA